MNKARFLFPLFFAIVSLTASAREEIKSQRIQQYTEAQPSYSKLFNCADGVGAYGLGNDIFAAGHSSLNQVMRWKFTQAGTKNSDTTAVSIYFEDGGKKEILTLTPEKILSTPAQFREVSTMDGGKAQRAYLSYGSAGRKANRLLDIHPPRPHYRRAVSLPVNSEKVTPPISAIEPNHAVPHNQLDATVNRIKEVLYERMSLSQLEQAFQDRQMYAGLPGGINGERPDPRLKFFIEHDLTDLKQALCACDSLMPERTKEIRNKITDARSTIKVWLSNEKPRVIRADELSNCDTALVARN